MKKATALLLVLACLFVSGAALGDEAKFVTIQDWLDAKGECGDCMMLVKIETVMNPVFAIAKDDTGSVNIFSGNGEDSAIIWFMGEDCAPEGTVMVIGNPRYNVFDGNVEMADWTIIRMLLPDPAE